MPKGNKKKGGDPNHNPIPLTPSTGVTLGGAQPKNQPTTETPDTISVVTPGAKSQKPKSVEFSTPAPFEFGNFNGIPDTEAETSILDSLAPRVLTKVKALQQLQKVHSDYEKDFVKELRILETKYEKLYAPLYEKRSLIVKGEYEPSKEDLLPGDQESFAAPTSADEKGIPEFWFTVLQRNEVVSQMITERDFEALKHLVDIKYVNADLKLVLEFTFSENPFFTNNVLVKTYHFEDDEETGEESGTKLEGTTINWKEGKDLTQTIVKKKIKQKGKVKEINRKEPCDSFFNFFNPKNVPEGLAESDELTSEDGDLVQLVEQDFEIGNIFKETLIPNAVKWFTGELSMEDDEHDFDEDEDDELDDGDEDDDELDDDEDDEDDDEPARPRKKGSKQLQTGQPTNTEQPPECKQQ